jgi:nicotinamidase/pyrazinamidase
VVHFRDFNPANHCFFADNNAGAPLLTEVLLRSDARQTMWLRHSVQHSWGSEFHPALHVVLFDIVARKGEHSNVDSYNALHDTGRMHHKELTTL